MSRRAGGSGAAPPPIIAIAATAFFVSVSAFLARSLRAAAKLEAAGAADVVFSPGDKREAAAAGLSECTAAAADGGRGGTGEKDEGAVAVAALGGPGRLATPEKKQNKISFNV